MTSSIPANPTSQTVAALLPKLHDVDPDYRYMSLNDLCQVLTNGRPDFLHSDYNTSARTVDGVIKTLDDQNGEVQNLAIKCLTPLVQKIPHTILAPLIEKLSNLNTENSVDNSIPSMALCTVVVTLQRPAVGVSPTKDVLEAYSAISRVLIPRLVGRTVVPQRAGQVELPAVPAGMLQPDEQKEIAAETVDILIEVVRCFGPMLQAPEVDALQEVVVQILESEKASPVVKKRAVIAISILAIYTSDPLLSNFASHLIESFRSSHLTAAKRRMYITIIGSMARSIPSRFGPYLKTLAPFVLSALSQQEMEEQIEALRETGEPDQDAEDVREAALVALEACLAACGGEMRSYTEDSITAALRYLKYDPNYSNDEDDEDMEGTQSDDDDMDGFDEDDDFEQDGGFDDDDDDSSWKVRRCASKVLYTLISTRGGGDLLEDGTLYQRVAPVLINRFSEREENVQLEVIAAMALLIRKTGEGSIVTFPGDTTADYLSQVPSRKRRRESSGMLAQKTDQLSMSSGLTSPIIQPLPASGPRTDLHKLSPSLIKAVNKLLKGKAIPAKQASITLLSDMVAVQHGGLSEYFSQIVDPVVDAIKSTASSHLGSNTAAVAGGAASATASTLRIAALRLVSNISETHSSSVLQPYLSHIIPGVVSAATDKFYKISGEAVSTVEQLLKALTPPRSRGAGAQKYHGELQKLFEVVMGRVAANDADVEVRRRAIHALGILLSRTGGSDGTNLLSAANRTTALDALNERLKNEVTRLAAVRAIDTIAISTTAKDQLEAAWVREVAIELAAQLRKSDRSLRGASLGALKNLILTPAARNSLDATTIHELNIALLPLISASDLHLLGPALLVYAYLVLDDAKAVATPELCRNLCDLLTSSLGGSVLDSLLTLVKNIGEKGVGKDLMSGLLQLVGVNGDPAVVGKVIGTLLVSGGDSVGVSISSFEKELATTKDDVRKSLALAILGEAGLRMAGKSSLKPETFTAHFDNKSDKVKLAAAVALGRAGAGDVPVYLPVILDLMQKVPSTSQYLLLHSIKEILQQSSGTLHEVAPYSQQIWVALLDASKDEDNKAVGAECIGRLAIIDPKVYMPQLQTYLQDKTPSVRAMVIQAIRYTLPDSDESFDVILKSLLINMLTTMLHDTELENRRLALTTLNSAAHNKPDLILPHLNDLLPLVMKESLIHPELVREVMMGPFKHKVDDGLEVRKSAYETLYSLMDVAFSRINTLDFYDRIIAGLADEHDIRSLCNLMLTKLIVLDPDETSRRLDAIADRFRTILSIKLKDNAVKQEIEKQDEASKGVLRVTLLLHNAIPGAAGVGAVGGGGSPIWRTYWEWVEKDFDGQLRILREEARENATRS